MEQPENNRYILHLLYANTIKRGGEMDFEYGRITGRAGGVEVIEDLMPIYDVNVEFLTDKKIKYIKLQPENKTVEFCQKNGQLKFKVDNLLCHQMVILCKN